MNYKEEIDKVAFKVCHRTGLEFNPHKIVVKKADALRICREAVQAERGKCAEAFRKRAEESCMTDYAIEEYIQVIKEANNGL